MQRVIRRLGFASPEEVDVIAQTMYKELRWEDHRFVLQYVSLGRRRNEDVGSRYPRLIQITWDDIADFLYERFEMFPEKLPPHGNTIHSQWPDFGRFYGKWICEMASPQQSRLLVWQYIDQGPQSMRR